MRTTAGGGYGDPLERDPDAVLADVVDGFVSRARARNAYGVVLTETPDDLTIDREATEQLRRALASERSLDLYDSGVTHDATRSDPAETRERRHFGDDPAYGVIQQALAGVPRDFCRADCPLRADPHRCPWHNAEMLEYWSVDALEQWTIRRCPKNEGILAGLRQLLVD